ncbi:MAG TPA: CoA-binding protein [Myxococcota bacterium]|nr:CoA-binding protein [Myxococcota bacterium]HQK50080.1 CoA-binding protein [Myxococcota bacterium]
MSLDALFRPRTVAVFGATPRPGTIGHQVVRNLVESGFTGQVIPVNPRGEAVCGLPAVTSLEAVPGGADLASIAVRAERVPEVLRQCGSAGVRAAIVHSAGFAEAGPPGAVLQDQCLEIARERGIRLLGPNAQGVQNGDPAVRLYATFTFTPLRPGPVSIVAQSGGVAELLNLHLRRAGVGTRLYASPGNAADIDIADLLDEASMDPGTGVVLLHLEGAADPARLLGALVRCREAGQEVLVLAGGRHEAGREAVASHTGALAASGGLLEALLVRAGARQVQGAREAVDRAVGLSLGPRATGRRVAVVCNAGGTGILALEAALDAGLSPACLEDQTRKHLREGQSPLASIGTIVDLTATAEPPQVASALGGVLSDPGVDAVLLSLVTPFYLDEVALCGSVVEAARGSRKPLVVHLIANPRRPDGERVLREGGVPTYPFPEEAATALSALVAAGDPKGQSLGTDRPTAIGPRPAPGSQEGRWLSLEEAFDLLEAQGVPCLARQGIRNPRDLALPPFPPPWVLKADLPEGAHKARQGAVVRGIASFEDLAREAARLQGRFPGRPLLVQPEVAIGIELALGLLREPTGLWLAMAGPGGPAIEERRGVRFRLCPLSLDEAREALGMGGSGADPLPGVPLEVREALAGAWMTLSRLPSLVPSLRELDLNPLVWTPSGLAAVDVRVRVLPPPGTDAPGP